jgi:hypothetical protein
MNFSPAVRGHQVSDGGASEIDRSAKESGSLTSSSGVRPRMSNVFSVTGFRFDNDAAELEPFTIRLGGRADDSQPVIMSVSPGPETKPYGDGGYELRLSKEDVVRIMTILRSAM